MSKLESGLQERINIDLTFKELATYNLATSDFDRVKTSIKKLFTAAMHLYSVNKFDEATELLKRLDQAINTLLSVAVMTFDIQAERGPKLREYQDQIKKQAEKIRITQSAQAMPHEGFLAARPVEGKQEAKMVLDYICKILVIGDEDVGKSAFILRAVNDDFTSLKFPASYRDFKILPFQNLEGVADHLNVKAQIWDVPRDMIENGSEVLGGYRGVLLIYDVTDEKSFKNLPRKLQKIRSNNPDAIIFLIGTKADQVATRIVGTEIGQKFALENRILFYEVSAKNPNSGNKTPKEVVKNLVQNIHLKWSPPAPAKAEPVPAPSKEPRSSGCSIS